LHKQTEGRFPKPCRLAHAFVLSLRLSRLPAERPINR
jgi:hypothetical protein